MKTFEEKAKRIGIPLVEIKFNVTSDVYNQLVLLESENDSKLEDYMRQMVDYFLIDLATDD